MPRPIDLYHITHIDNLASIIRCGGLLSNTCLQARNKVVRDISYGNIQDRRATKHVPCAAGGILHEYVPFYFAPRSPMLYTIHKGNVPSYQGGQAAVLHLVTTVEAIEESELVFTFTDGHAVMAYSDFYDDLDDLERIDWRVMKSRRWFDTDNDPNRKCKRQAEFLVYSSFPWDLIQEIGVINQSVQAQVRQILQQVNDFTSVNVYAD
jgi:ssDNA thymidine ADP-ribosyltransferase, DarT